LPKNREQDYQPDGENSLAIPQVNSHGKKDSQSRTCKPNRRSLSPIVDGASIFGGTSPWMYNAVTIHVDFKFPIMINQAVRETGEHDQLSAAGGDPASAHGSQTRDSFRLLK